MYTPEGISAERIDRTMLLALWANYLKNNPPQANIKKMVFAGMGKPTLPLNRHIKEFLSNYWKNHSGEAIEYDNPQGNIDARKTMSKAMSNWYKTEIKENHILFNVGGAGALKAIFSSLQEDNHEFRIITPFPYYSLYAESSMSLHPINVMNNVGYRLTAQSLKQSLDLAYQLATTDKKRPKAILFCDPNNPLGTVLTKKELSQIAKVLRDFPDLYIIMDESYAEMNLDKDQHLSLLSVAPDLKRRMIILRSGTKGLSAAGERMAITLAFDQHLMMKLIQHNIINCGHAPISLQLAYAKTMLLFQDIDRQTIVNFYLPKVEYVHKRIVEMGANLTENKERPEGAFYVLADFSDLIGEPLNSNTYPALGMKENISSDEDISYSLLFQDALMVTPLSYFGMSPSKGLIRITCSEPLAVLEELMNRLEGRLFTVRLEKNKNFRFQLKEVLTVLETFNLIDYQSILSKIPMASKINCCALKIQNDILINLVLETTRLLKSYILKNSQLNAPTHSSFINSKIYSQNT